MPRESPNECNFDRCQAGRVILPNAPRVKARWDINHVLVQVNERRSGSYLEFHPGCWKAINKSSPGVTFLEQWPHPDQINEDGTVTFKVSHG